MTRLATARLALEPLRVEHAAEMASVLGDPGLYRFTGGEAPRLPELEERYARWTSGGSAAERWLNWIVRERRSGAVIGWLQATLTAENGQPLATLAWTIGAGYQGCGFAREAAARVIRHLRGAGVSSFVAHIRPDHLASIRVAESIGLSPTQRIVDGEGIWEAGGSDQRTRPPIPKIASDE